MFIYLLFGVLEIYKMEKIKIIVDLFWVWEILDVYLGKEVYILFLDDSW